MLDGLFSIATTALIITGVGIALRPGSTLPAVIQRAGQALASVQLAAYGPTA
jgi:hypothetical protein